MTRRGRPPKGHDPDASATPPHLPPDVKEAVGRAIVRATDQVKGFLLQRGVPFGNAQDVALESAYIAYRSIAKGTLALPDEASAYDQKLAAYMRTVAWRLLRNHKRAGDIFVRHDREPGTELLVSRTYDVEPALELASEIAAEPPKARRFLLAMLETGEPCVAAVAAGMAKHAGKWTMRSTRARAAKRLAAI